MYRNLSKAISILAVIVGTLIFAVLIPPLVSGMAFTGTFIVSGLVFVALSIGIAWLTTRAGRALHKNIFVKGNTHFLGVFVDRLRFCFTTNDLITAFREILEYSVDCTVYLIDMKKKYTIYNSPGLIGTDIHLFNEIIRHYDSWREGVFFFDDKMDLVSDHRKSRGFFIVKGDLHLYFFMRFARVFEEEIFPELAQEFESFLKRNETIEKMFAIAAVSREWEMVAETQMSFIPSVMPLVKKMELASFFQPLVNVSGDYYDVLPIDEHRTLLMLGDVSGKGLAAALVMGVVINTVRILEKRDDLEVLVRSVDSAIKGMRLQDKYTVMFVGIVDTKKMTIRYINASMADPLIISETRAGRQIRQLESNCSLIGILEIDSMEVHEAKLLPGDVILMASDGVSEVAGSDGIMLGDTDMWLDFITEESSKPVREFVDGISKLVKDYAGGADLRDDVTMLAAKIGE